MQMGKGITKGLIIHKVSKSKLSFQKIREGKYCYPSTVLSFKLSCLGENKRKMFLK